MGSGITRTIWMIYLRVELFMWTLWSVTLLLASIHGAIRGYLDRQARRRKAQSLMVWLKLHSVSGIIADDSRDSIYTREDEWR